MQSRIVCLVFIITAFFSGTAFAEQRIPLPEFDSTYQIPDLPVPRAVSRTVVLWIMLTCYGLFIAAAIAFVHYKRSRKAIIVLSIASLFLLGYYFHGCVCPVGSLQNVAAALVHPNYSVPLSISLLFFIPLVAALFYGRVFCSAVCPLGAVQELTAMFNARLPRWAEQPLALLRYAYLGLVILFLANGLPFLLCRFDPYVGLFRFSGNISVLMFGGTLLLIGMFIGRPYCRFMCPYGALLGLCSRLAAKNVSITPGNCTNCQLCEKMCPYGAILPPSEKPSTDEYKRGPLRLLLVLLASPILIVAFALLARQCTIGLAMQHPDVSIVPFLRAEEQGHVPERGTFDVTESFYKQGGKYEEQYRKAGVAYDNMLFGTTLFGGWIGLIIAAKSVQMCVRRRRSEYTVDNSRCVGCGRCFWYCPNQKQQRVFLDGKVPF